MTRLLRLPGPAPCQRSNCVAMSAQALAKNTQLFHYLRNEWTFDPGPTPAASCWISFKVDFAFRSALYARAASLFMDEVVVKMVAAFDTRCRDTYQTYLKQHPASTPMVVVPQPGTVEPRADVAVVPPPMTAMMPVVLNRSVAPGIAAPVPVNPAPSTPVASGAIASGGMQAQEGSHKASADTARLPPSPAPPPRPVRRTRPIELPTANRITLW